MNKYINILILLLLANSLFSQVINTVYTPSFKRSEIATSNLSVNSIIEIEGYKYKVIPSLPVRFTANNTTFIQSANSLYATPFIENGRLELSTIGGVYGELETSNDYLTAKSIRQNNENILKEAFDFCVYYSIDLIISDLLEIWPDEDFTDGDNSATLSLSSNESISIKGGGKVKIYPIANTNFFNDSDFIEFIGSDMQIDIDIDIEGRDYWTQQYETYEVVLNSTSPAGDIKINETVRTGFWDDLQIGDTLALEKDRDSQFNGGAFIFTVSGIDEVNSIITIGTVLKGTNFLSSVGSDFSQPNGATLLGRAWKELRSESILSSTIETYSSKWRQGDNREDAIRVAYSGGVNSFKFINSNISNFYVLFTASADYGEFTFDNCNIFNSSIAFQASTGTANEDSRLVLKVDKSNIYDHGYNVTGGFISGDRGIPTGSGLYTSPNTIHDFYKVTFWNCEKYASRQYSAGSLSSKKSNKSHVSKFVDCFFDGTRGTRGAGLMTTASHKTIIKGCVFDSSNLSFQMLLNVEDCEFINSGVRLNTLNSPDQVYGADSIKVYPVNISSSDFYNSGADLGEGERWGRQIDLNIRDCSFYETSDGLGVISLVNATTRISNVNVYLRNRERMGVNSSVNPDYLVRLKSDNYVNESSYTNNNFRKNFDGYNLIVDNAKILYPFVSKDSLYDYSVLSIAPNTPVFNYKALIKNTTIQSSILAGSSAKPKFKFNIEFEDCKIYNLGYAEPMRIKSFTKGFGEATTDGSGLLEYWPIGVDGVLLNGTTLKNINLFTEDHKYTGANPSYDFFNGVFKIKPVEDITLTDYDTDNTSNIVSDITTLKAGREYEFKHILKGEGYLSQRELRDTTIVLETNADGTQTIWNSFDATFDNNLASNWVLESSTITTSSGASVKINGDGQIISNDDTIQGAFSNYSDAYYLEFETAPAAGTTISIECKYYPAVDHDNYWILK